MKLQISVLLLVITSALACKKGGDNINVPEGPSCDAPHSRLRKQVIKNPQGSETSTTTYEEDGLRTGLKALGSDTVLSIADNGQSVYHYVFNSAGDQYLTLATFYSFTDSYPYYPDTSYADFHYEFDSEHHLVKQWTHLRGHSYTGTQDSMAYRWENGNMVEEIDLFTGTSVATYHYYPGGQGRNPLNKPEAAARWLYRQGSTVVLSKDYVNTKGVSPGFDSKGRLTVLQTNDGTRTEFEYDCK